VAKKKEKKVLYKCDTCLFEITEEPKPEKCPHCAATDIIEVKKVS